MTTGDFTSWAGDISQIGPIYPFVGSEVFLVIVGVVFWLGWHALQVKIEKQNLKEAEKLDILHEFIEHDETS